MAKKKETRGSKSDFYLKADVYSQRVRIKLNYRVFCRDVDTD